MSQLTMDITSVTLFTLPLLTLLPSTTIGFSGHFDHFYHGSNVQAVAIVTRHAERTPLTSYPGDLNGQYLDQIGYGQLIPTGCRRMFKVGRILKSRFPHLKLRSKTVLKSSSSARCIDTVKCLMDGIDGQAINFDSKPSILSNSLTIQLPVDPTADVLLNHAALRCPVLWGQLFVNLNNSQIPSKHPSLWSNLSHAINKSNLDIHTVLHDILDSIVTEHEMNLPLPVWVTSNFIDESYLAINAGFNSLVKCPIESNLTGLLLTDLVDNLKSSSRKNSSLIIYSTHDTTLSPIMAKLGVWSGQRPNPGESLVFELRSNGQLRMFYLTSGFKFKQLTLIGCTKFNCTLDHLDRLTGKSFNWNVECNSN